jgi:photosystem II biogenesis protein Psp29
MEKLPTVSDTKRNFYSFHTRPINSIYRTVVEELMVEMHLLSVNVDFKPDPFYYLGVVTTFDRFMSGYSPESDKDSIFKGICRAINGNPEEYRRQAETILALAKRKSPEDLINWLNNPTTEDGIEQYVVDSLKNIVNNPKFKYSRVFAIGLYNFITENAPELLEDKEKRQKTLTQLGESFNLPTEKMQKDLDLYRSNLETMKQTLNVLKETLEASRKKRLEKEDSTVNS